jgi:hypothetical protein
MNIRFTILGMIGVYLLPLSIRAQIRQLLPGDSITYFQIRQRSHFDTSFYSVYPKNLTVRAYVSNKYTRLLLSEPGGKLKYQPNTPPNIGIGGSYRFISLNLSAGLGFFAPPRDKGKTHYLDLQSHLYLRTITVDLFAQFYRGYYIPDGTFPGQTQDYSRPDVKVNFLGVAGYYVFNFRRFSYRASLIQDEWQQKSAGSLLAGWELYYGAVKGDSALAPTVIHSDSTGRNITGSHFLEMGPGIGYAYTLVLKKHYFITGAATVDAGFGFTREYGTGLYDRFGITPNLTYRAAAGYSGKIWGINVSWINTQIAASGIQSEQAYRVRTGTYRLTVSKRLGLSARTRRKIDALPQTIKDAITP